MKLSPIQTQLGIETTALARANHLNSHIKNAGEEPEASLSSGRNPLAATRPPAPLYCDMTPESRKCAVREVQQRRPLLDNS
jgi:hypothetical protein